VKTLVILNDPPYGTERSYSGLRLAGALVKRDGEAVRVFLMGDAVACAKAGQAVPRGWYNLNHMLTVVTQHGGEVGVCGSCMDARGLKDVELLHDARRSTLEELTEWTLWADQVLTF
jgi:uncharacterized protein involved in oxidation of intracellular sulfur